MQSILWAGATWKRAHICQQLEIKKIKWSNFDAVAIVDAICCFWAKPFDEMKRRTKKKMQKSIKIIQEKVVFAPSLDWNFPLQLMGVYAAKRNHFNLLKIRNLFVDLYFSLSLAASSINFNTGNRCHDLTGSPFLCAFQRNLQLLFACIVWLSRERSDYIQTNANGQEEKRQEKVTKT